MNAATPTEPSPTAIELIDVQFTMNSAEHESSVMGIHWKAAAGEFWVIGGLLGAGKSTLLSTIAGLHPPVSGAVKMLGIDWTEMTEEASLTQRLKVGLVHAGGLLLRHLSVAANIALPLRYHHNLMQSDVIPKLHDWLVATELELLADRPGGAVSRHWAQRASLARACITQPEILLLDNPLSGLDPQHARWWIQFLERVALGHPLLGYRKITVVVTCDDMTAWRAPGRRYATLASGHFKVLDGASHLDNWATARL